MAKFKYKERSREDVEARKNQSGGARESIVRDDVKLFVPKEGDHTIRILPPTWDGPKHYGFDVFVHYGIGADNNAFICLEKMAHEKCPICLERARAEKAGEEEYAGKLKPTKRVAMYVIDRDKEEEGAKLWISPWTVDRDISAIAIDKKSKEVYALDHPEEGFDVSFSREGKGQQTKYIGFQVARRDSPISDDEETQDDILQHIQDNPIPDLLILKEYDDIEEALMLAGGGEEEGEKRKKKRDEEEDERPKRKKRDSEEEEEPPKKKRRDDEEEAPARPRLGRKPAAEEEEEEEPPKKKRRDDEEEEEEPPKKKRRDDEEEEEPPPKKKRREEEEEEEEPPKRKKRDSEEEEEPPKKSGGSSLKDRLAKLKKAKDD